MRTADTPATQATRDRILEGARVVLTRQGLRGTTVQHVLVEASVSRRTFYQYFRGLEGLTLALYCDFTEAMTRDMKAAMDAESDPISKVRAGIAAYLDVEEEHGQLLIGLQAEAIRSDSPLSPRRIETIDAMVELVDEAVVESLDVHLDPLLLRSMLLAIEGAVIATQARGTFDHADRERVEAVARAIFLNVLAGWMQLPRRPEPLADTPSPG